MEEHQLQKILDRHDANIDRIMKQRDEHLDQFIRALLPAQELRDKMIKMESKLDSTIILATKIREEDIIKIATSKASADKAHSRIDRVIFIGGISVAGFIMTSIGIIATLMLKVIGG